MFSSYLKRISAYSPLRFILEVTALAFISRFFIILPVAIILSLLGFDLGVSNIETLDLNDNITATLLYALIIAPFIETLVFQWLPLKVLNFIRIPVMLSLALTTLLFAYVHLDEGLINFLGMLPIGFLFVWSFYIQQKTSTLRAVFIVFAIHSLTNLLATLMYILSS